ncbi:hypothetical protein G6F56_008944 [Rhizopus delemar]|nr:hypothetical protein G6F56_008944 [Rhizopus delemar]
MPKNAKEPFFNAISLVTAKISQFETTLRTGLSTLTASQNDMHQKIEDNNKKINSLEELVLQEISALRGVIQIQQMESAALRRELEIS